MRTLLLLLGLLAGTGARPAKAQPAADTLGALPARVADRGLTQGLWVWSDTVSASAVQRERLLDFCVDHQFNHLALGVYLREIDGQLRPRHAEGLASLLAGAARRGLTVGALRGERRMAFADNHERALRELDALLRFHAGRPDSAGFVEVHYDIEPYLTDQWRAGGAARRRVQTDYLAFLDKARPRLHAAGLELAVDIPYWFDKADLALEVEGEVEHFSTHILRRVDSATLMSYHRDPVRVLEQVAGEAEVAHRLGRRLHAAMEVGQVRGAEHFISFHWVPVWRFWRARVLLEEEAMRRRGLAGVYVHHYRALHEKLYGKPPFQPR